MAKFERTSASAFVRFNRWQRDYNKVRRGAGLRRALLGVPS